MTTPNIKEQLVALKKFIEAQDYLKDVEKEVEKERLSIEKTLQPINLAITEYNHQLTTLKLERERQNITEETGTEQEIKVQLGNKILLREKYIKVLSTLDESILAKYQAQFATDVLNKCEDIKIDAITLRDFLDSKVFNTDEKREFFLHAILEKDMIQKGSRNRALMTALRTIVVSIDRANSGRRVTAHRRRSSDQQDTSPQRKILQDLVDIKSEVSDSDEERSQSHMRLPTPKATCSIVRTGQCDSILPREKINRLKQLYTKRPTREMITFVLSGIKEGPELEKIINERLNQFANFYYKEIYATGLQGEHLKQLITIVAGNSKTERELFFEEIVKMISTSSHDFDFRKTIRSLFVDIDHAHFTPRGLTGASRPQSATPFVIDSQTSTATTNSVAIQCKRGSYSSASSGESSRTSPLVIEAEFSSLPSVGDPLRPTTVDRPKVDEQLPSLPHTEMVLQDIAIPGTEVTGSRPSSVVAHCRARLFDSQRRHRTNTIDIYSHEALATARSAYTGTGASLTRTPIGLRRLTALTSARAARSQRLSAAEIIDQTFERAYRGETPNMPFLGR